MRFDELWWALMRFDEIWWNILKYDEIWWDVIIFDEVWWGLIPLLRHPNACGTWWTVAARRLSRSVLRSATMPRALAGVFAFRTVLSLHSALPKCLPLARNTLSSQVNLWTIELSLKYLTHLSESTLRPRRGHICYQTSHFHEAIHPPPPSLALPYFRSPTRRS